MKHYSSETMRLHAQDLANELEVKQIEQPLRYFIVNNDKGKITSAMYSLGTKQVREWVACGVLDLHDLSQECYCALIKAYAKVDWDIIEASTSSKASLWAYLKKSVKLDFRMAINTFKDGMRIPHYKIWEAKKSDKWNFEMSNYFSVPMDNYWMFENLGSVMDAATDKSMSSWETEELYTELDNVMHTDLSHFERQIIEMSFGINQPHNEKRSYKYMSNYFKASAGALRKTKERALKKLKNEENKLILKHFIEN